MWAECTKAFDFLRRVQWAISYLVRRQLKNLDSVFGIEHVQPVCICHKTWKSSPSSSKEHVHKSSISFTIIFRLFVVRQTPMPRPCRHWPDMSHKSPDFAVSQVVESVNGEQFLRDIPPRMQYILRGYKIKPEKFGNAAIRVWKTSEKFKTYSPTITWNMLYQTTQIRLHSHSIV